MKTDAANNEQNISLAIRLHPIWTFGFMINLTRLLATRTCIILALLTFSANSTELVLSGTVVGTDQKPIQGVEISLLQAKKSTLTNESGEWKLAVLPTGVVSRSNNSVDNDRLIIDNGRLLVRFQSRDVSGRGRGTQANALPIQSAEAYRVTSSPDTLLYSLRGKIVLRDTISSSQTNITRTLDTIYNPRIIYGYLMDSRDGNVYRTVKIGHQIWMAQNLNYKVDSSFCFNNDTANCSKYGRLYQWAAAVKVNDSCNYNLCSNQVDTTHQGACPIGWHVPSTAEWTFLSDSTLNTSDASGAGTKLKTVNGWENDWNGTDDFGFAVRPSGLRNPLSEYRGLGNSANFWSATEGQGSTGKWNSWQRILFGATSWISSGTYDKITGNSIRCLRD